MIPVCNTIHATRLAIAEARSQGRKISLVPTMGALHAGHASLVKQAAADGSYCVLTIFVNPTQFGPKEDFAKYPRTFAADCEMGEAAGASLVFAPSVDEMYPPNSVITVDVAKLGDHLCGRSRPGHFRGVCTVVAKLFNIAQADYAYFGQKDAQQAAILKQLARDLNFPVEVRILPTEREADGLAMSSRNRYLSPEERAAAPQIFAGLTKLQQAFQAGEKSVESLLRLFKSSLSSNVSFQIDYIEIVDARLLQPLTEITQPALAATAVFLGTTRLIDNVLLVTASP
jgi:pantoate--beta-alanine ligase